MSSDQQAQLRQALRTLQVEHRDLDDVIERLKQDADIDQLQLVRLKKRKLALKDAIVRIESQIIPDILA